MRILHVTRDFPPQQRGGLSTVVQGMTVASRRAGLEVAVCSFDDWRPLRRAAGSGGTSLPGEESAAIRRVRGVEEVESAARWAMNSGADVIHLHDGMLWSFAESLRRELQAPLVASVHVLQRELIRMRGGDTPTASLDGEVAMLCGADLVVVPSRSAATIVAGDYPDVATRLRLAPHGIDDSPLARAAANGRRRAGGPVLYVGRFADIKGTDDFLTAIPGVLARIPDATFVVAGGVPGNPRAERRWRSRWENRAARETRARISFPGWLAVDRLSDEYARAAVIVVPSHSETFGLVAAEAMLHGVPVVAAAAGALPELIEHDRSGLLYEAGDVAALGESIAALLTDEARARRLAATAAAAVRTRHSWQAALPSLLAVYDEAVGATGRRG